ncbi:MAG: molybdopterin-dependent oxidoreductase [Chloroflexi bacterium]|nr:molybdopterin-dependent oxidoreductase [Chloroflexota bacterium]
MTSASLDRAEWTPTACNMCYARCSILVRKRNGVMVKIEGNPASPVGNGRLCPKGVAGIMTVYDPNRIKTPLKRTNPDKGIGIDPGWVEITWEEALDTITTRLKKVRAEDPRKLLFQATTTTSTNVRRTGLAFVSAFGSPNSWTAGGGIHCGNGAHVIGGVTHASWSIVPDYEYCQYAIYFGSSKGHSAGHVANTNAQKTADARARGMKLVVIDPMCGSAAAKATEWVPIRVGTDAALALAMANVLLNELRIWDAHYLKHRTNGAYLIGPDGIYVRDSSTGRPLVWDPVTDTPRPFDDDSLQDMVLEGEYEVDGARVAPGFQLLKNHVKKYTPEMASEITTVPAGTIRRLARELGENARIGSKIVIDGKELPYRPVAVVYFRGAQGHRNSLYNCLAIELLTQIVGAADVPGGTLGFNPVSFGHPETQRPRYAPTRDADGLMLTGTWVSAHKPYPPREPKPPQTLGLLEIFAFTQSSTILAAAEQEELWEKCKLPYRPEVLINWGANSIMSVGNAQTVADSLKRYTFILSFDVFLNEFTDFADIVLPDTTYLERYDPYVNFPIFSHPAGLGTWGWPIGQPVVAPPGNVRNFVDVMIELGERVGILEGMNGMINVLFDLRDPYKLELDQKYAFPDVCDRVLKMNFGEARGLEWFEKNGVITWPKRVEEVYWRPFIDARVPIYWEHFVRVGRKVKDLAEGYGLSLDYGYYGALPDWLPCPSHQVRDRDYDLFGFYYRDVLHTNSFTMENPWLDEASQMNPLSYVICLNADTAKKKGLKDGDEVWVESVSARRVRGKVKLTEGLHPEALGVGACAGHWSRHQPIARGKGVFFNELLEIDLDHINHANSNLDLCVKVRIRKV